MKNFSLFILGLLLMLVSCSPQKQLDNLQEKHPDLFQTVTVKDTVIVHDTLRLAADEQGKVFEWESLTTKTFTMENDRSKTVVTVIPPTISNSDEGRVLVNTVTKEVEVPVIRRIVVTKEVKVPVSKVVKPKWVNKLIWFNVIFFLLLGLFIWYLFRSGVLNAIKR